MFTISVDITTKVQFLMNILLIIAILNGDILEVKQVYPVQDIKCEELIQHPAIIKSWKEIYGDDTVFYCVEG